MELPIGGAGGRWGCGSVGCVTGIWNLEDFVWKGVGFGRRRQSWVGIWKEFVEFHKIRVHCLALQCERICGETGSGGNLEEICGLSEELCALLPCIAMWKDYVGGGSGCIHWRIGVCRRRQSRGNLWIFLRVECDGIWGKMWIVHKIRGHCSSVGCVCR